MRFKVGDMVKITTAVGDYYYQVYEVNAFGDIKVIDLGNNFKLFSCFPAEWFVLAESEDEDGI